MSKEKKGLKYPLKILDILCERQNRLIKEGVNRIEDLAIGTSLRTISNILEEVNRKREKPLKSTSLERTFRDLKREGYLKPFPEKSGYSLLTPEAFQAVGREMLPLPGETVQRRPLNIPRDKIHINIECRVCHIVDGYLEDEKECRHCGATLYRMDAL